MSEKFAIGKALETRLEARVVEMRKIAVCGGYTSDHLLILDAFYCIRALRQRDPMQVEAENIIRRAANTVFPSFALSIKQRERSQS